MPTCETIQLGGLEIRFLLDHGDTGGAVSSFEFVVPPGAKVPAPHYHEAVDEMVYGLDGVLTYTVDGQEKSIGPGDCCFVPRGVVHHFVNRGDVPSRTLAVLTPGSIHSAYFREMAALLAAGPLDPAAAGQIMRRHGLVSVPAK
jgi:quercetin dioxygenase-like cupin family protein